MQEVPPTCAATERDRLSAVNTKHSDTLREVTSLLGLMYPGAVGVVNKGHAQERLPTNGRRDGHDRSSTALEGSSHFSEKARGTGLSVDSGAEISGDAPGVYAGWAGADTYKSQGARPTRQLPCECWRQRLPWQGATMAGCLSAPALCWAHAPTDDCRAKVRADPLMPLIFHSYDSGSCPSRRELLQAGAGLLGLSLSKVLKAESFAPGRPAGAKSVIFLYLHGGPSQLETFDMKPDAPAEIRGPFRPIASRTPDLRICEHLSRCAAISNKFCVVRTLSHTFPCHSTGSYGPRRKKCRTAS